MLSQEITVKRNLKKPFQITAFTISLTLAATTLSITLEVHQPGIVNTLAQLLHLAIPSCLTKSRGPVTSRTTLDAMQRTSTEFRVQRLAATWQVIPMNILLNNSK
jgi:hypothetical protein